MPRNLNPSFGLNINPELGKPQGNYFGISVTDGYDWDQCYSWAWECLHYFSGSRSAYECFPDIPYSDEIGLAHQIIAICEGLTDRPNKRFFEKKVIIEK